MAGMEEMRLGLQLETLDQQGPAYQEMRQQAGPPGSSSQEEYLPLGLTDYKGAPVCEHVEESVCYRPRLAT